MSGAAPAAVSPFPPPPRFYEEFEPFSNTDFKCPPPPKPQEGPYMMFGTLYDTAFEPQHPNTALEPQGLAVQDEASPVAALRQLNRALPDQYLQLIELMISRPVLCTTEDEKKRTESIDQQRYKIERLIAAMYLSLARFRPFQARQALITTLRAQVERRKAEAKALRECRERAQTLISAASSKLAAANNALQAEAEAETAAAAAAEKDSKDSDPAAPSNEAEAAPNPAEPPAASDPPTAPAEDARAAKRRKTASLLLQLDSLSKPNSAPPPPE